MYFWAIFDDKYFKPSLDNIDKYISDLIKDFDINEFNLSEIECKILSHYAKKSRLEFSVNKYGSRFKIRKDFHKLLEKNLIKLENNLILIKYKNFVSQNKVLFNSNYTRFYFYFLKPLEKLIQTNQTKAIEIILNELDNYLSFAYEQIAKNWCEINFDIKGVCSIWGKDYECDLFYQDYDFTMIGEVKFKGKKMCISDYNKLKLKAFALNLNPDKFILFSKSGFSKKLLNLNDSKLILKNHNDFEKLLK